MAEASPWRTVRKAARGPHCNSTFQNKTIMNSTRRILVVDDEPSVTRNLKLNLEADGDFKVHIENDANRTVPAARSFRPDLILLDVIMPGVDGGEAAARLESDPFLRQTPIIFLTAIVTNEETGGQEMVRGDHTFIAKPVDIDELKQSIRDHLRR